MAEGFYGKEFDLPKGSLSGEKIIKSKNLLWMADYDYITARKLYLDGDFFALQVCNHLQQAFEKYLKFATEIIFGTTPDTKHNNGNWQRNDLFKSIPKRQKNAIKKMCEDYIKGYRYFERNITVELNEFIKIADEFVYEYYSLLDQIGVLRDLTNVDKLSQFISADYGKSTNMLSHLYIYRDKNITIDKEILIMNNNYYDKTYDLFQKNFINNSSMSINIKGLPKEVIDHVDITHISISHTKK